MKGINRAFALGAAALFLFGSHSAAQDASSATPDPAAPASPSPEPTPPPDYSDDLTVYANVSSVSGPSGSADYRSPSSWMNIDWTIAATGGQPLSIDLVLKNLTFVRTIATVAPKLKTYKWVLPNDINTGQYRVRVGYPANPNATTAISSTFKITFDPFADFTKEATIAAITQPQSSERVAGEQIIVMWTVGVPGGKKANIDLVQNDPTQVWLVQLVRELAVVAPNATSWVWTVPPDLPTGKYSIRIGYPSTNNVNYSPSFPVKTSVPPATAASNPAATAAGVPSTQQQQQQQQQSSSKNTASGAAASGPRGEGSAAFVWAVVVATATAVVFAGGHFLQP